MCHGKYSELGQEPDDNHGTGSRQHEPRRALDKALGQGHHRGIFLTSICLSKGFKSAYEAGNESEKRDADATLPWDSEKGELEYTRGNVFVVTGEEE